MRKTKTLTNDEILSIQDYLPETFPAEGPMRRDCKGRPRQWNGNVWRAAAMRAKHETWDTIAAYLGISWSSVTKYPGKQPGFLDLVVWFAEWFAERSRTQWALGEQSKVLGVIDVGLEALRSIIAGEEQPCGRVASPAVRANTALRLFRELGYSEARVLMVRSEYGGAEDDRVDYEDAEGLDTYVDPRIEDVDFEPA